MTYRKNSWGTYAWDPSKTREENLLSAERLGAAVTQDKMNHIEQGIEDAHIKTKELEQVKASKSSVADLESKKADVEELEAVAQNKADTELVESMLEGKVNNIDFEELDNRKADKNEVNDLASKKADKSYVDSENQKINTKIDGGLDETAAQLAQNIDYTTTNSNLLNSGKKKRKVMVSFIADDAPKNDLTKLLPIMQEKQIPVGIGVVTDFVGKTITGDGFTNESFMTWEELRKMVDNGAEILSHSKSHKSMVTLTNDELMEEMGESKRVLSEKGFIADGFIYPYNYFNNDTIEVASNFYKYSFARNTKNTPTIDNNAINRYSLGSFYDTANKSLAGNPTDSLAYYKERVDIAMENDEWLVFVLHTHNGYFDSIQQNHFRNTIDYIRSLNIDIVSPREGFERYGNIVQIKVKDGEKITIDADGKQTGVGYVSVDDIDAYPHTGYFKLANYPKGITHTPISTENAQSITYPTNKKGVLTTYNFGDDYSWREYTVQSLHGLDVPQGLYAKKEKYHQYWEKEAEAWTHWELVETNTLELLDSKGISSARKITDFARGITINPISYTKATLDTGFPIAQGGTLTTYNLADTPENQYQTYEATTIYNMANPTITSVETETFIRHWVNNKWTTFKSTTENKKEISFANGWKKRNNSLCKIHKSNSLVTISFTITGGVTDRGTVLFTLDPGFRPDQAVDFQLTNVTSDGLTVSTEFGYIDINGTVCLGKDIAHNDILTGNFSYPL